MWLNNSNSVIGNIKWHFDVVNNTLPKIEFIAFSDWWWTGSCEYADLVFGVDSWAEFKQPDMTGSCTNPFLQLFPKTPIPRVYDTRADIEVIAGVAHALGHLTGDQRMLDYWKFVHDIGSKICRILDSSRSGLPVRRSARAGEARHSSADDNAPIARLLVRAARPTVAHQRATARVLPLSEFANGEAAGLPRAIN
jgi:nitrate reductase alpha subunit